MFVAIISTPNEWVEFKFGVWHRYAYILIDFGYHLISTSCQVFDRIYVPLKWSFVVHFNEIITHLSKLIGKSFFLYPDSIYVNSQTSKISGLFSEGIQLHEHLNV